MRDIALTLGEGVGQFGERLPEPVLDRVAEGGIVFKRSFNRVPEKAVAVTAVRARPEKAADGLGEEVGTRKTLLFAKAEDALPFRPWPLHTARVGAKSDGGAVAAVAPCELGLRFRPADRAPRARACSLVL